MAKDGAGLPGINCGNVVEEGRLSADLLQKQGGQQHAHVSFARRRDPFVPQPGIGQAGQRQYRVRIEREAQAID